jgi:hypothetical protein
VAWEQNEKTLWDRNIVNFLNLYFRQASYRYKRGTTAILSSKTVPIDVEEVSVRTIEQTESMDEST